LRGSVLESENGRGPDPVLLLGHGAGGTGATMQPMADALGRHGVRGVPIDLPKGRGLHAVPTYRDLLAQYPGAAVGGHSYGGRVASLLAAQQPVRALVLLSYPLHPPGRPDDLRTEHWPDIACPVLLLSGDADPFATVGVLSKYVKLLRNAELYLYPGVGHGLASVVDDAAGRIAAFLLRACEP
jgi:predicted alpha/beta-hydrolase family hydrolase